MFPCPHSHPLFFFTFSTFLYPFSSSAFPHCPPHTPLICLSYQFPPSISKDPFAHTCKATTHNRVNHHVRPHKCLYHTSVKPPAPLHHRYAMTPIVVPSNTPNTFPHTFAPHTLRLALQIEGSPRYHTCLPGP